MWVKLTFYKSIRDDYGMNHNYEEISILWFSSFEGIKEYTKKRLSEYSYSSYSLDAYDTFKELIEDET